MRLFTAVQCTLAAAVLAGCAHPRRQASLPQPADDSYFDVKPGTRLRVVTPLTRSGNFSPAYGPQAQQGGTIVLSAKDLIGFRTVHYVAEGKDRIRLRVKSAEITREGKSSPDPKSTDAPFALPAFPAYVRLIYLIRASAADHNMAIIAAKRGDALEDFTRQLQKNPEVCSVPGPVFCAWIPAGVALRPEL